MTKRTGDTREAGLSMTNFWHRRVARAVRRADVLEKPYFTSEDIEKSATFTTSPSTALAPLIERLHKLVPLDLTLRNLDFHFGDAVASDDPYTARHLLDKMRRRERELLGLR